MQKVVVDPKQIRQIQRDRSDRLKALGRRMSRRVPMPPKVRAPPSQNSRAVSARGRFGPAGIHSGLVRKS